jgi:hypothetical protein
MNISEWSSRQISRFTKSLQAPRRGWRSEASTNSYLAFGASLYSFWIYIQASTLAIKGRSEIIMSFFHDARDLPTSDRHSSPWHLLGLVRLHRNEVYSERIDLTRFWIQPIAKWLFVWDLIPSGLIWSGLNPTYFLCSKTWICSPSLEVLNENNRIKWIRWVHSILV